MTAGQDLDQVMLDWIRKTGGAGMGGLMSVRAVSGQDAPFVRNEASDARDHRGDGIIFSLIFIFHPKIRRNL